MKDLSMHIMDIVENSISAQANRISVDIVEKEKANIYSIMVSDNGTGMSKEFLNKVEDPWTTTRTSRNVGLGIPLLKQNALHCGGSFSIASEPNKGTQVFASFAWNHIDRPPAGNIAGTFKLLIASHPTLRFLYHHTTDIGEYQMDTLEIKEALEGVAINQPGILKYIEEMIQENLGSIRASHNP